MTRLEELGSPKGARKKARRVGRGTGSGRGKTSGRGHKGARSRSGASSRTREGGQMPIYRRMPHRGFVNPNRRRYNEVTLGRLQSVLDAGLIDSAQPIDTAGLLGARLFKKERDGVRLIRGGGELKARINITVRGCSKPARDEIEKLGGTVTIIERKPKPAQKDED
ncbi:MAG: 50S ribosomal protein L15 [Alphaproteobacteria bacterium]|nr:50S ribosomal protein L15 [Alphaproteobacteria bacterium]MDA7999699.1 50S ribosomal protein L15 [Alphaproteobacteria bacterium]MDA8003552.1 50S ribosomal protein L15 [Alphaproteobacteria bacterium]MDA8005093.1 50S ribosomal protein L15 [Alphaproteobacteria bacterium]MDA8012509.1 50S ribosomal protein L15 [Alphaproteobacteria bacterium]